MSDEPTKLPGFFVIAVDVSTSMWLADLFQPAIEGVLRTLKSGAIEDRDYVMVVSFSKKITVHYTGFYNLREISESLPTKCSGGTSLYNTIAFVLDEMKKIEGYENYHFILLTDGADNVIENRCVTLVRDGERTSVEQVDFDACRRIIEQLDLPDFTFQLIGVGLGSFEWNILKDLCKPLGKNFQYEGENQEVSGATIIKAYDTCTKTITDKRARGDAGAGPA